MEEGLLIGSDFDGGYGSIQQDQEPTIVQPEEAVVAKTKAKSKRQAASSIVPNASECSEQVCKGKGKRTDEGGN